MTITQIDERLAKISQELETGDIDALEKEFTELTEKRSAILAENERRQQMLNSIKNLPVVPNAEFRGGLTNMQETHQTRNLADAEYERHFMDFVCRGVKIPTEYRAITQTSDTTAVIPTTIANEIISQAEMFGNLFGKIRRIDTQGGVQFPILGAKPTANWITETNPDPNKTSQKITAKDTVIFNYHGLECKIAQSLLVNVVTLDAFKRLFIPLSVEAMVKAIEMSIIKGDGNGQMMGILNEPRLLALTKNQITMTAEEACSFEGWHKKVFATMQPAYKDGIFIMSQGTFESCINAMTDQNGQPIGRVNYGIEGGETYRFGGRLVEIVEESLLPAFTDAAAGDAFCIYMKPTDYAINTNMNLTITHWTDNDTNELKNKCTMILDGKLLDVNGVLVISKA